MTDRIDSMTKKLKNVNESIHDLMEYARQLKAENERARVKIDQIKRALDNTGYSSPCEFGDDIAARITKMRESMLDRIGRLEGEKGALQRGSISLSAENRRLRVSLDSLDNMHRVAKSDEELWRGIVLGALEMQDGGTVLTADLIERLAEKYKDAKAAVSASVDETFDAAEEFSSEMDKRDEELSRLQHIIQEAKDLLGAAVVDGYDSSECSASLVGMVQAAIDEMNDHAALNAKLRMRVDSAIRRLRGVDTDGQCLP